MAAPALLHHSHQVLNADFCPGYTDALGKWNTGFPCPWPENTSPRYCCGTETFKYCCTGQEKSTASNSVEDPLLLVLAITLGVAAGITLLTLVACFLCPGCLLHKKRRPGPLYRLPCSSTLSSYVQTSNVGMNEVETSRNSPHVSPYGVASMYSLSEPLCRSSSSNHEVLPQIITQHRQETHRGLQPSLYWNRPVPRLPGTPTRMAAESSTATRNYRNEFSPPPPYESNHRGNLATAQPTRPAANEAIVRHISPRQPPLCIVQDHPREASHLLYHSTKF